MNKQMIRFIDPCYKELFRVPDNSMVTIKRNEDMLHIIKRVRFIDDYHLFIGGETYHICQLAEFAERNNLLIQPENPSDDEFAAWQIGATKKKYLSVQGCDDGWDYSFYDETLELIDGGQLNNPKLKIEEARNIILEEFLNVQFNLLTKIDNFEQELELRAQKYLIKNSSMDLLRKMEKENEDCFGIFQLPCSYKMIFEELTTMRSKNVEPKINDFNGIYMEKLGELKGDSMKNTLENIYLKYNVNIPDDYRGHSLSVSDVVVVKEGRIYHSYMVGKFQFDLIPEFLFNEEFSPNIIESSKSDNLI